jgi:hypothetical protein
MLMDPRKNYGDLWKGKEFSPKWGMRTGKKNILYGG